MQLPEGFAFRLSLDDIVVHDMLQKCRGKMPRDPLASTGAQMLSGGVSLAVAGTLIVADVNALSPAEQQGGK